MAYLASDNTAPTHPKVMQALNDANDGISPAYGADAHSQLFLERARQVFASRDLLAFPVFNGSASNGLALAHLLRPHEAVICHEMSHINNDECGLPEAFSGSKLIGLAGANGKLEPQAVEAFIIKSREHAPHSANPRIISVTQSSELGTIYQPQELWPSVEWLKNTGFIYIWMGRGLPMPWPPLGLVLMI